MLQLFFFVPKIRTLKKLSTLKVFSLFESTLINLYEFFTSWQNLIKLLLIESIVANLYYTCLNQNFVFQIYDCLELFVSLEWEKMVVNYSHVSTLPFQLFMDPFHNCSANHQSRINLLLSNYKWNYYYCYCSLTVGGRTTLQVYH